MKDNLVEHFPFTSHPVHKAAAKDFIRRKGRKAAGKVRKVIRGKKASKY